jgi:biopolymer transport protein ExbD
MAKRKRNILSDISRQDCKLEMTPMIDVTFLLLIFFMCTLKFKTLEGKLSAYLPKDVGVNKSDAPPKEKIEIRIEVEHKGQKIKPDGSAYTDTDAENKARFIYDSSRRVKYSIGTIKTSDINVIRKALDTFHRQDPTRPVTIDARQDVINSDVVTILDAALDVDFTDITFVGSYER